MSTPSENSIPSQKQRGRPRKPLPDGETSLKQIADHFKVTKGAVQHWGRAGCPLHSIEAVDEWRKKKSTDNPQTQADAKLKKTLLEIERLELQNAETRKLVVPRDEVREAGMRIGAALASELQLLLADVGMFEGLDAATLTERLRARLNLLLERTNQRLTEVTEEKS